MAKAKKEKVIQLEPVIIEDSSSSDGSRFKVNPNESKEWSISVAELSSRIEMFKKNNGGQKPKVMKINSETGENLNYVKVAESLGLKVYSSYSQEADLVLLSLD